MAVRRFRDASPGDERGRRSGLCGYFHLEAIISRGLRFSSVPKIHL